MASAQEPIPKNKFDWLRWAWEKLATPLAIIGLIDLSKQLIEWAEVVHWVVERYRIVKEWLFGWLPFHIPSEWHDYIILLSILFSVASVGFYRRTRRLYALYILQMFWLAVWPRKDDAAFERSWEAVHIKDSGVPSMIKYWCGWLTFVVTAGLLYNFHWEYLSDILVIGPALAVTTYGLIFGAVIAWRWIVTTAAIFAGLVIVNEIYVHWLA